MIVQNNFTVSENFLPHHVCDDIIKLAKKKNLIEGVVGNELDKKIRDSRIVWLDDVWIYDWITPFVKEININLNWNFNLLYPEQIQFTTYKQNQFYGWHQDTIPKSDGEQRKISVVIPLSNSEDYEGGDLEFFDSMIQPESKQEKIIKDEKLRGKGNAVVFPSYVYHRVSKVMKGERLSIVIWYVGEKWK